MLYDIFALFDDKTSFAGRAAGNYQSTYSYDTGVAGVPAGVAPNQLQASGTAGGGSPIGGPLLHDIGRGKRVGLIVQVTTAFVGAGATVTAQFVTDSNQNLTTTPIVPLQTGAVPVASLVAGYRFDFSDIPSKVTQEFVGMQYVIAVATLTAGNLSAFLLLDESRDDHADILGAP